MTEPRAIPNNVKAAMTRSDEMAAQVTRVLSPIIMGRNLSQEEILRRVGQAAVDSQQIARMLEKVGANTTDPISESL